MKLELAAPVVALLLLVPFVPSAHADDKSGSVSVMIGARSMDESDWEPVDGHSAIGISLSFDRGEWPIELAFDIIRTEDDATVGALDVEGETLEVAAGVRKFWGRRVRPYIGGGLCMTKAEFEAGSADDDDTGGGVWANAGLLWRVTRRFNLGLDVRVSRVDATLFGSEGEVGGDQVSLLVGTGW